MRFNIIKRMRLFSAYFVIYLAYIKHKMVKMLKCLKSFLFGRKHSKYSFFSEIKDIFNCKFNGYKYGYKVVFYDFSPWTASKILYSCIMRDIETNGIKYIPGQFVKPHPYCGPLVVFDVLFNAIFFMDYAFKGSIHMRHIQIWKCIYLPSEMKILYCRSDQSDTVILRKHDCPTGTCFARKVKLIKRIK